MRLRRADNADSRSRAIVTWKSKVVNRSCYTPSKPQRRTRAEMALQCQGHRGFMCIPLHVESRKGARPGTSVSRWFPFPAHQTGRAQLEHPAFRLVSPQRPRKLLIPQHRATAFQTRHPRSIPLWTCRQGRRKRIITRLTRTTPRTIIQPGAWWSAQPRYRILRRLRLRRTSPQPSRAGRPRI